MWSKYDEVLVQNPFFKEIQEHHEDILEKSSEENWVICVPRNGTIDSRNITIEAILDHILIPEGEKHQTLSKKYVVVQNGYINKHSSHDSDSVGILFEETFYVKKKSKYKVWCIDCPLFWKRESLALQSIRSIQNLHDCLDFLWSESLGHSILDGIKNVVLNSAMGSKAIEAEDLQTQKEYIGILYSQCLQVGMKIETINDKTEDNQFFDIFKLAVETYMQYCLGRKLIYSIGSACHQADAHLTKIIKNSSHLHYQDLGISSKFLNVITLAKSELSRINSYFTALEKINCLKKTFDNFRDLGAAYSTSDHILTVLVFIILKLNITNWVANLIYLKDFRLCSLNNSDQIGFVITSFEAAIEFIKSSEFLRLNKDCSCNHSGIKALHEGILSGQISPASPKHNEFKLSPCHPLCVCNECEENERARSENIDPTCGQSLLISATISGITEVVEFLLNQGIDPNETDCVGKTSMHHAVSRGYQSLLLLLLSYPVNLNLTDKDGNTPLHLACLNGQENCVKALIYSSKIIDLDSCNLLEETPLHLATVCGYYEIVKILLENGASPFVKNKRGLTPFDVAPNYYIRKMFQKCMHKIPLETSRSIEDGASSQPEQIEQQIENFRKIDLLLKAIESNDLPLTNFYLGFHTKPQFFNHGSCHPLCNCSNCQNNTVASPTETQLKPVNVNMSDMNGFTPLHVAAKFGRTEVLRLLLDSGASTNVKTSKTHYTPLHLACINRRTQIVAELLKCGDCSVNSLDFEGNTPLFYACQKNDTDVVKMLLQCEADCRIRNSSGQSAFQYCEENMLYGLMKILNSSVNSCVNWSSTNSSSDDGNMSDLV